jgi:FixJ family two-component response regulator
VISIVDDDESVREATKGLVRSFGYVAATFASAEEFLRSDRVSDTSCLISDVQMSGLSGVELQDRLWYLASASWEQVAPLMGRLDG